MTDLDLFQRRQEQILTELTEMRFENRLALAAIRADLGRLISMLTQLECQQDINSLMFDRLRKLEERQ